MGGEKVIESWFGSLWRGSRKSVVLDPEKAGIGILAFEVTALMSKVVRLWQCVSDQEMVELREEIVNSLGIQKLVSEDEGYLMELVLAEIFENFGKMVRSVAVLGKRCADPVYHHLERVFDDPVTVDVSWCGWEYRWKKMERKVKKMERFVAFTAQLYQEVEVLSELEQSLRRMKASGKLNQVKAFEFQKKVLWQRQEVKNLREMSPWIRTYDYTVRLLLRSLFTTVERIKHVFGINQLGAVEENNGSECVMNDFLVRSHSFSAPMRSSVHPSENNLSRLYLGPIGRSVSSLGTSTDKNRSKNKKLKKGHRPSIIGRKHPQAKARGIAHGGPFKRCMVSGSDSPILQSCMPTSTVYLRSSSSLQKDINTMKYSKTAFSCCNTNTKVSLISSKHKKLNALPYTLGDAALALHYANVIILIEKLSSSPHLISLDARDDLYYMLPTSIRNSLRAKLKFFGKRSASSIYDAALLEKWNLSVASILEWLAPLAHKTISWHSERSFEKQRMVSGINVLLVQTLYFANQAKTEDAITELLMGLSYILRSSSKTNGEAFLDSACGRAHADMFPP
ncbi:hypothetical protein RJ639_029429 [Escallonia herrerae]|uniref:Uncharacterized protein n=1 Tax=Escallonia herrerae TaxID=1293975 RepID=A0AA88US44_9ASTE|nr:hypothetical protein RJ639_029429 [Escallonia herrerae]